jgi:SAM-dependent methyltransferase
MNLERDTYNQPIEKYQLGQITSSRQLRPEQLGIPVDLAPGAAYALTIKDPYIDAANPVMLAAVKSYEKEINDFARDRREQGLWHREAGTAYIDGEGNGASKTPNEWGDPVARELGFRKVGSTALLAWHSKVPSATALGDVSDPFGKKTITDKDGVEFIFDDVARHWLAGCTDGRGIRSRGTVFAEIIKNYIATRHEKGSDPKWMSVACGTALPAMKAAVHAELAPDMALVDWDQSAMAATERLAEEIDFKGHITKHTVNIFSQDDLATLRDSLGNNGDRPKILDLMGIFEYTGEHIGVDPAQFLRSNYDMLQPGGELVFGQMRDDRPLPDFTMGVLGWPYIVMRSPAEVMQIVQDAGIETRSAQLYVPDDGVYTVCSITKPTGHENFALTV